MRRLLIVDPCPQTRLLLKPLLTEQGYELRFAADAAAALEAVWADSYGLVLVDMTDPAVGGEALLKSLRACDPAGAQKLAAFVPDADEAAKDRALRAGCSAALEKPINFHDLTMVLSGLLPP